MNKGKVLSFLGNLLICLSLFFLYLTFSAPVKQESRYQIRRISAKIYPSREEPQEVGPVNTSFSIVIPKISASAPIVAEVDPGDPKVFNAALSKGVAHAKGTRFPGEEGNVYLFAHSTDSFFNVNHFNAVFYLIGKLEQGDEIKLYYKDNLFRYRVSDKMVVSPQETGFLYRNTSKKILTLQTCYPPGTAYKRLIVRAEMIQ